MAVCENEGGRLLSDRTVVSREIDIKPLYDIGWDTGG